VWPRPFVDAAFCCAGVFKRWQERYFTIQGHYLKYYTDCNKIQRDLKGTIDLSDMTACEMTNKKVRALVSYDQSHY
jgi:hypothetical protein